MPAVGGHDFAQLECAFVCLSRLQCAVFRYEFHPLRAVPSGGSLDGRRKFEQVCRSLVDFSLVSLQSVCRRCKFNDNAVVAGDNASRVGFDVFRKTVVRSCRDVSASV